MSPRPKNAYSTARRAASCVIVIVDPQPLPMSPRPPGGPGAAPRFPGAPRPGPGEAAGSGSVVQRPEKSGTAAPADWIGAVATGAGGAAASIAVRPTNANAVLDIMA